MILERSPRRPGGFLADLKRRLFAALQARGSRPCTEMVAPRKRRLFSDLSGTVLEIGPGVGTNLRYYPTGIRWIGLEPNRHMHRYLRQQATSLGLDVDLRHGSAERIDLPDASVDAVVSTLVLCSVGDLPRVLAEVCRVLKPGGRFIFLEHVAAPPGSSLRRVQRLLRPAWRFFADGCEPDRDIPSAVRQAGFVRLELGTFRLPVPVVSPHMAGVAFKGH